MHHHTAESVDRLPTSETQGASATVDLAKFRTPGSAWKQPALCFHSTALGRAAEGSSANPCVQLLSSTLHSTVCMDCRIAEAGEGRLSPAYMRTYQPTTCFAGPALHTSKCCAQMLNTGLSHLLTCSHGPTHRQASTSLSGHYGAQSEHVRTQLLRCCCSCCCAGTPSKEYWQGAITHGHNNQAGDLGFGNGDWCAMINAPDRRGQQQVGPRPQSLTINTAGRTHVVMTALHNQGVYCMSVDTTSFVSLPVRHLETTTAIRYANSHSNTFIY